METLWSYRRIMALIKYFNYAIKNAGDNPSHVAPAATITVYDQGTTNLSSIYEDSAGNTAKSNPFTADSTTGYFEFYVARGSYDIKISGSSVPAEYTWSDINIVISDSEVIAIVDGDTTPDVSAGKIFKTSNTAATTITDLDNAATGQEVVILIGDGNTTIDFTGTNLKGNSGVDWSPNNGDHMTCIYDGTSWYCNISDNTA